MSWESLTSIASMAIFILAFVELFAAFSLVRIGFNLGFPIYRKKYPKLNLNLSTITGKEISKKMGCYKIRDSKTIHFIRHSIFKYNFLRLRTVIPYKAILSHKNGSNELVARMPLFPTILLAQVTFGILSFWGYFLISAEARSSFSNHANMTSIVQAVLFSVVLIGYVIYMYIIEKKRMQIMISELETILADESNNSAQSTAGIERY